MFDDMTAMEVLFHMVTKLAIGLVLVGLWFYWIRNPFRTWAEAKRAAESDSARSVPGFPIVSALVMVFLSCCFLFYVTFEQAFRDTNRIDSNLRQKQEQQIKERDEGIEAPAPYQDPDEQLEQQTEEKLRQLEQENEAAKERFMNLPKVGSNQEGGATPTTEKEESTEKKEGNDKK